MFQFYYIYDNNPYMIVINSIDDWYRYIGESNMPKSDIVLGADITFTRVLINKIYLGKHTFDGKCFTITYYRKPDSSALFDIQNGTVKKFNS